MTEIVKKFGKAKAKKSHSVVSVAICVSPEAA
jgi:hypothetical protein